MNIQVESYGHTVTLILEGELTADSLEAFRQAVDHQLKGKEVVDLMLNLQKVSTLDSVALEYLLDLQEQLAERLGQVRLVAPDEAIRKILEITRLDKNFEIFEDATEAMKVLQN